MSILKIYQIIIFRVGIFDIGENLENKPFIETSVRSDIQASSYGYLKVFVPINGN